MERVVCPVLIGREVELTELEDALLAANRGDGFAADLGIGDTPSDRLVAFLGRKPR